MTISTLNLSRKQKEMIKVYVFLFTFVFVAMDWAHISWLFNYQGVSRFASPDTQDIAIVKSNTENQGVIAEPQIVATAPVTIDKDKIMGKNVDYKKNASSSQIAAATENNQGNYVEIPSINLKAPVVIGTSTDPNALHKDLDKGAVYYPDSVLPGQAGQTVILGHSAPVGWPAIKHDTIFSNIYTLPNGTPIILHFKNHVYTYRVQRKMIVEKGQDLPSLTNETGNVLTLVSCWPPGKDYQRSVVEAVLQN